MIGNEIGEKRIVGGTYSSKEELDKVLNNELDDNEYYLLRKENCNNKIIFYKEEFINGIKKYV